MLIGEQSKRAKSDFPDVEFIITGFDSMLMQENILTDKGEFEAHTIESKINRDDYLSLVARFSQKEELQKRVLNIETLIIRMSPPELKFFDYRAKAIYCNMKNIINGSTVNN